MSLELVGKLIQTLPEQSGEGKNGIWRKKEFVIETGDQYPKKVCMVVWGDRINMLDTIKPGDTLKVGFDLESREYQSRWYTDIKAWKIEAMGSSGSNQNDGVNQSIPDDPFPDDLMSSGDTDDLPF